MSCVYHCFTMFYNNWSKIQSLTDKNKFCPMFFDVLCGHSNNMLAQVAKILRLAEEQVIITLILKHTDALLDFFISVLPAVQTVPVRSLWMGPSSGRTNYREEVQPVLQHSMSDRCAVLNMTNFVVFYLCVSITQSSLWILDKMPLFSVRVPEMQRSPCWSGTELTSNQMIMSSCTETSAHMKTTNMSPSKAEWTWWIRPWRMEMFQWRWGTSSSLIQERTSVRLQPRKQKVSPMSAPSASKSQPQVSL